MNNRLILCIVFSILLILPNTHLFSFVNERSDWLWANKIESPYAYGFSNLQTTTDALGNTYFAGSFSDQIFFDNISMQSQGSENLFLSKIDTNGNWLWAKNFTSSWNTHPWQKIEQIVAVGNDVYMLGYTYFPITIDGITIEANTGGMPLGPFVVKFNSSGVCTMGTALNPTSAPDNHYIFFKQMTVTSNAIYVAGSWNSPLTPLQFGQITVSGYNDGDTSDSDILYAKLNLQGNIQWVKAIGGPSDELLTSICCDSNGNVYFGGEFSATMYAGSIQLVSNGFNDVFVVKIDSSGIVGWGSKGGSTRDDTLVSMAQRNGTIYISGRYTLACNFGQYTLQPFNSTISQPSNIYVASVNLSGSWNSVNRLGNTTISNTMISDMVFDDNVYVLLPRVYAPQMYPLYFDDDFSWYSAEPYTGVGEHIIAGLNCQSNSWFGMAYASQADYSSFLSLTSDNQNLYLATPVTNQISFGNINVTATMSSCYAIAKVSKSEVVENEDETNTSPCILNMAIYPNPARSNTDINIEFQVKTLSNNSIDIFNFKGQKVMSFNSLKESGKITWRGLDENSNVCASGMYFCTIKTGGATLTKKVVLIK